MKRTIALTLTIILLIIFGACGCQSESPSETETPLTTESSSIVLQTEPARMQNAGEFSYESEQNEDDNGMKNITVTIGNSAFLAKLYDNDTATAFLARLPVTLDMSELNGNEKYNNLPDSLPADSQWVENIHAGDLMLYGSDCLVLFYESFNTSYSYTKLGYIEDVSGLAAALGSGSVQISFDVGNPLSS